MADQEAFLTRYVGAEIEVFYGHDPSGLRDRGQLRGFGDGWIELVKGTEVLLIPASAVRLAKVVGPATTPGRHLLRPADPERPAADRQGGDR